MTREIFNPNNLANYGKRGFRGGLSTLGDFKQFLLRGNVVDLAVGVVIGAAFNGVVQAMVKDLITPFTFRLHWFFSFCSHFYLHPYSNIPTHDTNIPCLDCSLH